MQLKGWLTYFPQSSKKKKFLNFSTNLFTWNFVSGKALWLVNTMCNSEPDEVPLKEASLCLWEVTMGKIPGKSIVLISRPAKRLIKFHFACQKAELELRALSLKLDRKQACLLSIFLRKIQKNKLIIIFRNRSLSFKFSTYGRWAVTHMQNLNIKQNNARKKNG